MMHIWWWRATIGAALLPLFACASDGPTALRVGAEAAGTTVTIALGDRLELTLGTTGPGSYVEEPQISGTAIVFEDVTIVPPFTPGGVRQRFRFRAVARGDAQIVIPRLPESGAVDTTTYVLGVAVR